MNIILKEDIDHLGHKDDVVSVKDGYARNFLIPQGKAIVATRSALKMLEETLRQRSHKEGKILEEAQAVAKKLEGLKLEIGAKAGENGKIFGSVNTIQISEALTAKGFDIDRKHIRISDESIKELGSYEATIKLHKEVAQTITFDVVGE